MDRNEFIACTVVSVLIIAFCCALCVLQPKVTYTPEAAICHTRCEPNHGYLIKNKCYCENKYLEAK